MLSTIQVRFLSQRFFQLMLLMFLFLLVGFMPLSARQVLAVDIYPAPPRETMLPQDYWLITADTVTFGAHAYPPIAIPEFKWDPVDGATLYRLQVSNDIAFTNRIIDITTPNTTFTPYAAANFSDGIWYWRVKVETPGTDNPYTNPPLAFTKQWATLDNKPVLLDPANSATIGFYDLPVFSWNPAIGASAYRIEIDNNNDFTSLSYYAVTLAANDTTPLTHQPVFKLANGLYYWRVIPLDPGYRNGTPSEVRQFNMIYSEVPTLITPEDGSNPTFTPTFQWYAVRGAEYYRLQYSTDPTFNTSTTTVDTRNTTWTPTSTIANDVNYYWRVKAISGTSESDWSDVRSFLKKWYIQAKLLEPPNNYLNQYMPPLFNWTPVPGAARYKIQIDDNQDFSSPLYDATVANTFYTPSGATYSSLPLYYWRVIPIDGDGKLGLASETFSYQSSYSLAPELVYPFFYYDPGVLDPNQPPETYVDFSPVENRTIAFPLFVWHRSVDRLAGGVYANAYRIQVDDNPNFPNGSIDWEYDTQTLSAVPAFADILNTELDPNDPNATIYYWRVAAISDIGGSLTSAWSHSRTVRFDQSIGLTPTQAGDPVLIRPANGEEHAEYTPRFDWFPYVGATSYQIEVSRDSAFTEMVDTATVEYPSYAPQHPYAERHLNKLEFGTFYWHVRAMDGATPLSGWSEIRRFQIAATSQWVRTATTVRSSQFKIGSDTDDQADNNFELIGLFATQTQDNWHFGLNVTTAGTNMTYAFYLDSNYQEGSGATYDACGYNVTAISTNRPEYVLYVNQVSSGFSANNTALYSWNASTGKWNVLVKTLTEVGGSLSYASNFLEVKIPNTAIGFNVNQGGYNVAALSFSAFACVSPDPIPPTPPGPAPMDIVPDNPGTTSNFIDHFSAVTDRTQLVFPFNNLGGDPTTYPSILPFAVEYPTGYDPTIVLNPSFLVNGPSTEINTPMPEILEGFEPDELTGVFDAGSPWSGGNQEVYLDPLFTTMIFNQTLLCNCQYFNWQNFTASNDFQGDNSYYWRFRTRFFDTEAALGSWSEGFRFEREGLIVDNMQISVAFATPTFSWSIAEGAQSYALQIDNDPVFGTPEINIITQQNSYTPPFTLDNGTYYWHVRIIRDGNVLNGWSPTQSFTLSIPAPENLVHFPLTDNGVVDRSPTFCWDPVIVNDEDDIPILAAWRYRLQYSLDSSFSTGVVQVDTEQSCYTPISPPSGGLNDGTYFWRVAMIDGNYRLSQYSEIATVTKQYPVTELIAPLFGVTSTPTFVWSIVNGAKSYRLEVSTSSTFSTIYDSVTTDNTRYTPMRTYDYNTYYWRVAIVDWEGRVGPFNDATIILDPNGYGYRMFLPLVIR